MTVHEIIDSYNFSHKFLRLYIVALGRDMLSWNDRPNQNLLNVLDIAELYTTGAISDCTLLGVHNGIFNFDRNLVWVVHVCRCATWWDADIKIGALQAGLYHENSKSILLNQIKELSELEKIMLNIPKDLK